jgi:hypothetical protein
MKAVPKKAPSHAGAMASFRQRSFRFQWMADLSTSCAFEMETIMLSCYILVETISVLLLTLFASTQYIGTLLSPLFAHMPNLAGGILTLLLTGCAQSLGMVPTSAMLLRGAGPRFRGHVMGIHTYADDLQPARRLAGCRAADQPLRLSHDGDHLLHDWPRGHGMDRGALARACVGARCAGK